MPDLQNPFIPDSADVVMPFADQAVASTTPTDATAAPFDNRFELDAKAFMIETMERPFFMISQQED